MQYAIIRLYLLQYFELDFTFKTTTCMIHVLMTLIKNNVIMTGVKVYVETVSW